MILIFITAIDITISYILSSGRGYYKSIWCDIFYHGIDSHQSYSYNASFVHTWSFIIIIVIIIVIIAVVIVATPSLFLALLEHR